MLEETKQNKKKKEIEFSIFSPKSQLHSHSKITN